MGEPTTINSPVPMASTNHATPAEKTRKFSNIDFKRWQLKMFFYLTTLSLQRCIIEDVPVLSEKTPENEVVDVLCAMHSECSLVGNPKEWWIDSGATRHVCANKKLFSSYTVVVPDEIIFMANSNNAKIEGIDKICLKMTSEKIVTLNNFLHVPEIQKNLVSTSLLVKNGFKCVFVFKLRSAPEAS